MQYTFTLRRNTGLLLLAGLAVCFALTFLAGWVVGLSTQVSALPADTTATSSSEDPPREQGAAGASVDSVTARNDEASPSRPSPPADDSGKSRAAAPDAEEASAPPEPAFALQIGAFTDSSNAHRVARRVQADGRAVRVRVQQAGARTLHQVQVGRYERRRRAARHVDSVRAYTGNALVVRARSTP
jgi:cell division septation protein DedD